MPDNEVKGSKTTFEDLLDTLKELEAEPTDIHNERKSYKDIWGNFLHNLSIFTQSKEQIFLKHL